MLALPLLAAAITAQPLPPKLPDIIVSHPRDPFPASSTVPPEQLASMRGGMLLPNGLDIAIGIDIQTRLDGMLVLHTIYSSDGPNAGVSVYTDGADAASTAPNNVSVVSSNTTLPTIVVDRSPTGTSVTTQAVGVPVQLNLVQGAPSTWLDAAGQDKVPVTANGPAIPSEAGDVSLRSDDQGAVVTLEGAGLEVRHLVGQATGVVVANTVSDRVIDTVSSINVDVQGVSPALMTGIFAANRIATDAMQARGGL